MAAHSVETLHGICNIRKIYKQPPAPLAIFGLCSRKAPKLGVCVCVC